MRRVVVVASSEIDRSELERVVHREDELLVVIPAVEQSRLKWLANDEDEARARAAHVGEQVAETAPADADVEVKPDSPRQLVLDAIAEHDPDLVVLALRQGDEASWLEEGELEALPTEIEGVPLARIAL